MSSPPHISSFQLHIQMNLSLVQTNPCLKSHVRATPEMSPRGGVKYLETWQNIQIHFELAAGLKFDLRVRCRDPSCLTFWMVYKRVLSVRRSHCCYSC